MDHTGRVDIPPKTTGTALLSGSDPMLDDAAVRTYLDELGMGSGPLSAKRIGEGQSNVTFLIQREGVTVVLRRGPRPPLPPSAHDMMREARILRLLGEIGLPVPPVLASCDDESLIGVPFYLMQFVPGHVITDHLPPSLESIAQRRAISVSAVDALARLHTVDITGDLAGIGRPAGYLQRQVTRFSGLWSVNSLRSMPAFDTLTEWLTANIPARSRESLVHGDYRLGNLMYADSDPTSVSCILDWEMATLGDPLADLGYFLATYSQPGEEGTPLDLTPVTRDEGFLSRAEIVARYEDATGHPIDELPWYQAFALWKGAVFCEAIYTRWLRGERPEDTTFAPTLATGIPNMLETARALAGLGA